MISSQDGRTLRYSLKIHFFLFFKHIKTQFDVSEGSYEWLSTTKWKTMAEKLTIMNQAIIKLHEKTTGLEKKIDDAFDVVSNLIIMFKQN